MFCNQGINSTLHLFFLIRVQINFGQCENFFFEIFIIIYHEYSPFYNFLPFHTPRTLQFTPVISFEVFPLMNWNYNPRTNTHIIGQILFTQLYDIRASYHALISYLYITLYLFCILCFLFRNYGININRHNVCIILCHCLYRRFLCLRNKQSLHAKANLLSFLIEINNLCRHFLTY